ncbi:MAG: polyprenyl diphosphate synthase [Candidatus Peregrinibacteria bacterium]
MNIGFIADGNRRWARKNGFPDFLGHEKGFAVLNEIVLTECLHYAECTSLAVYAFSTENWKRSPTEIAHLFRLYQTMIETWKERCVRDRIALKWAGRRDRVPGILKRKIEVVEKESAQYSDHFVVYICLDYGSHDEMARAVQEEGQNFEKALEVPMLDMIIRSGGEQRLSNFCLYQAEYAELFFEEEYLPEFTVEKMEDLFARFAERERRRGG